MRKALALLVAVVALCAAPAFSQSVTAITGNQVLDSTGVVLGSGQWCLGSSCFTVTNGVISAGSTVTNPTVGTIAVKDGTGTTILSIPGATVSGLVFNWNTYVVPTNAAITVVGQPLIACYTGATATSTDTGSTWKCAYKGGVGVWVQNAPVVASSGIYAGPGAPTFKCISPCVYTRTDAAAGAALFTLQAAAGTSSSNWIQQAQGAKGDPGQTGGTGPAGPSGSGTAATGNAGDTQIVGGSGQTAPSDNTTLVNTLPVQEYTNVPHAPLAYWDAGFHNCTAGVVNLVVHGDSRSVVTATMSSSIAVQFGKRWVDNVTTYLQAVCGSNGTGLVPFRPAAGSGPGSFLFVNPDYYTAAGSYTTDSTLGPYQGGNVPDAMLVKATSNGATITFNAGKPFDHLNCYGVTGSGLYPWTMNVDGASVGTCGGTGSTPTAVLATGSGVALATHTASVVCATAPCEAYGLQAVAGTTGVSVSNFSVGSCAAECFGLAPSTQFAFSDLIPGGQHLDILNLIANEPGVGYSTTQFQTTLNNMVAHDRAMTYPPSILLISPLQDGIGGQAPYYPIIRSTAQVQRTAFLDMRDRWGPNTIPMFEGPDNFHENNTGHAELSSAVISTIVDIPPVPSTLAGSSCTNGKVANGVNPNGTLSCVPSIPCGFGYAHSVLLYVSAAKVSGTVVDYPAMISFNGATPNSITLSNLAGTANGGQVQKADGTDVQMCDATGNYLSYEKVAYTSSTGAGLWYARLPSANSSTGATIKVYWGNATAADTSDMAGTWRNYAAVYHTNHLTSPGFTLDSTGNGQTLTFTGGTSGGTSPVGETLTFSANAQAHAYATGGAALPQGAQPRSMEAWYQATNGPQGEAILFGYGVNGNAFSIDGNGIAANNYFIWIAPPGDTPQGKFVSSLGTTWHHLAYTLSGAGLPTNLAAFVDGAPVAVAACTAECTAPYSTPSGAIQLNGIPGSGSALMDEAVSEFRISTTARAANWYATQYQNQTNPSTFFTLGTVN